MELEQEAYEGSGQEDEEGEMEGEGGGGESADGQEVTQGPDETAEGGT